MVDSPGASAVWHAGWRKGQAPHSATKKTEPTSCSSVNSQPFWRSTWRGEAWLADWRRIPVSGLGDRRVLTRVMTSPTSPSRSEVAVTVMPKTTSTVALLAGLKQSLKAAEKLRIPRTSKDIQGQCMTHWANHATTWSSGPQMTSLLLKSSCVPILAQWTTWYEQHQHCSTLLNIAHVLSESEISEALAQHFQVTRRNWPLQLHFLRFLRLWKRFGHSWHRRRRTQGFASVLISISFTTSDLLLLNKKQKSATRKQNHYDPLRISEKWSAALAFSSQKKIVSA